MAPTVACVAIMTQMILVIQIYLHKISKDFLELASLLRLIGSCKTWAYLSVRSVLSFRSSRGSHFYIEGMGGGRYIPSSADFFHFELPISYSFSQDENSRRGYQKWHGHADSVKLEPKVVFSNIHPRYSSCQWLTVFTSALFPEIYTTS